MGSLLGSTVSGTLFTHRVFRRRRGDIVTRQEMIARLTLPLVTLKLEPLAVPVTLHVDDVKAVP